MNYNFKFLIMICTHLKYDSMHKNEMFYALIFTKNHVIANINYMLSITIPLTNAIKNILLFAKFLKVKSTPQRNPKRIQLREKVGLIVIKIIHIKKRDPKVITNIELGEMTSAELFFDCKASTNIILKVVFE